MKTATKNRPTKHGRQGSTGGNSTYPKVAVQWLNQALCYYQSFCLVDNEVLRNRHLWVAAKRSQNKKAKSHDPAFLPFNPKVTTL